MLRQIRNALITAFVISLTATSLSYATAERSEPLEVQTTIQDGGGTASSGGSP